jgi:cytochrome b involved in lipid metabolism
MTINKKISLMLGIIVVVSAAGTAIVQNIQLRRDFSTSTASTSISTSTAIAPANKTTATLTAQAPNSYTLADVAQHPTASSCWSAIDGNVYDLTSWINQHPGGPEAILGICGTDGSAAFNAQHGGQSRPETELATFKIGTLVQ